MTDKRRSRYHAKAKVVPQGIADDELRATVEAFNEAGTYAGAARILGIDESNVRRRMKSARAQNRLIDPAAAGQKFTVNVPKGPIDVEELWSRREKQFERKAEHEEATKLIDVEIHEDGPFALLGFGDPHVDDDGTDLTALREDSQLVLDTDGYYCFNVGDTTNNWVGRLAALYGQQSTSAEEAWALAEHWIKMVSPKLLWMVGGNHDAWSGSGDPLKWITRQTRAIYQSSEVRVRISLPSGFSVVVNNRHDFAGHSQYNAAHGASKALQFGVRDHIAVNGHRHVSGHAILKDPASGRVMHATQVSSYKRYDRYAKDKGFRDQTISPSVSFVIDPSLPETNGDMIKVFWDPRQAARYLTMLRRDYEKTLSRRSSSAAR